MHILLLIISIIVFCTTGIGYLLLNILLLGILELSAILFAGFLGFILLGILLSWLLE